jgi:glutathione synthase/RimK-type ligase-like ATP-grasp enzyme
MNHFTPAGSFPAAANLGRAVGGLANSKVLVIATQNTVVAARISIALFDVGFGVATVTPREHPIRRSRHVREHYSYHNSAQLKSIIHAIKKCAPGLLVCTDDRSVAQLIRLHQRAATSDDQSLRKISELIELSLGPPASFPAMRSKGEFLSRAAAEGLRCPKTFVAQTSRPLEVVPAELTYPIVIKADQSYGGVCVRIVRCSAEVRSTVWELQTPTHWRIMFRKSVGAILGSQSLTRFNLPLRRTVSVQQFISGRPSNRAVICWKGKVLAGISVEALEVTDECGPASVIRVIEHPEMTRAVDRAVECLNLSGFVGFDFIVDSLDQAWMIEMNPRVTPICHFSLTDGTNLAASLYAETTGVQPLSRARAVNRGPIALFPNEGHRSASSEYLLFGQHDVPWQEPEVVLAVLNQTLQTRVYKRVRMVLERYFPAVVSGLIKLGLADPRRPA